MRLYGYIWIALLTILAWAQGLVLNFIDIQSGALANNMSEINFIAPGNDFGGMFFWLAHTSLQTPEQIIIWSDTISCYKQLRWLYYNAQRWERVWPLDSDTLDLLTESSLSYSDLSLSWWLYTLCVWTGVDARSIMGQVQYNNNAMQNTIIAGVVYNYQQNSYDTIFANSFQYIINTTPLWYIYDTVGWIWFVAGMYTQHDAVLDAILSGQDITQIFQQSWEDIVAYNEPVIMWATWRYPTPWYIAVDGIVGITSSLSWSQSNYITNTQEYALVLPTTSFTTADITNQLRRKAASNCQWRANALSVADTASVLCFIYADYNEANMVTIDLTHNTHANKTIFIKNGNAHFIGSMDASSDPIQLFVNNGNIVRDTTTATPIWFDQQWNPTTVSPVAHWLFLRGNILIDGLLMPDVGSSFDHKVYIHGKILSLHTPDSTTEGRDMHIIQKFSPYDYRRYISLEDIFARRCNPATGLWSDGSTCGSTNDSYAFAPLILIDRYFPWVLLQ